MGKKLVIVESPTKARTISKILGNDYEIQSSMGHVRDLPVKTLGVDIKNSFKPKYVVVKGRKKIIDSLKKAVEDCDAVYLAPDPDREGEAIAWHLKSLLTCAGSQKKFFRVQYNEITPSAVRRAFENPGQIDLRRVDAQQARRILDRIVGYKVSPMLWRRMKRGLSAGRVQSVALRLVCEREEEITKFVPEEYWIIGAMVRKLIIPLDPFKIKLVSIDGEKADVRRSEQAEKIKADLEGRELRVMRITMKEVLRRAAPPYITSSLQQACSSYCGISPGRTMIIAQRLYEGVDLGEGPVGLITYMRTDSFTVAQDALVACRDFIAQNFGNEYCPEKSNFYKSRASAQQAHEAIRPTDVCRPPESLVHKLSPVELKVYGLIWRRFVASQMSPARIEQRTVMVDAPPRQGKTTLYSFQATASEVKFPGYMKVAGIDFEKKNEDGEQEQVQCLPNLSEEEHLECIEWLTDQKETQPPSRYSEASLVRALEKNGIGRPSTYAQIISTLHQRKYVTRMKRTLVPMELGMRVNNLLVSSLGELFDVKFTASMEDSLDKIEDGAIDWTKMLGDFYEQFEKWMEHTRGPAAEQKTVERILSVLELVKEWVPEVKMGKRTYNDEKFVKSIRKQMEAGKTDISQRQQDALLRIAYRYRDQAPEIESLVSEVSYVNMLDQTKLQPPKETTLRKLELLKSVTLNDSDRKFVDSLGAWVNSGRCLTEAQVRALNNVVLSHAGEIEDFERLKSDLDVDQSEIAEDTESAPLLDAMVCINNWNPPVTRGRKVFNDKDFYDSLRRQFARKRFLSVRQKAALKKMVGRYRGQIPDYENIARKCGVKKDGLPPE